MAGKLSHVVAYPQIPQLDCIVSTSSQKCVKGIVITERSLIELHCVRVSLMPIVHRPQSFISDSIIHNQFFIGASEHADCRSYLHIVKAESWDVLGGRMRISLQEFVKTSLLQPLHIIFHLVVEGKFELVKVNFVARCDSDDFIIVEELCLPNLLWKLGVSR